MMTPHSPQVDPVHYDFFHYCGKDRWLNYWYQAKAVFSFTAKSVLEIGPGDGTVTTLLRTRIPEVKTCDIDTRLSPDCVASVTSLPFPDNYFDLVLCSEVLEHVPFSESKQAIKEIFRVAKKGAVIGVPHAGIVLLARIKIPLIPYFSFFTKIPFFWKTHIFNGEHYWETGKKGYSQKRVRAEIENAGFTIISQKIAHDDPSHLLFVCKK